MGEPQDRSTYKVLSTRTIVWFGVILVMVGAGGATALLWAYGAGSEADKARLDAIRTAGTIVVGTGGIAALWLAARRQQATEIALRQKDADQAHQERDATERRVTELYTKAVEQLGSDKAPVRLGGMYALERLAQNVPDQRQTIVNVLCAYLRMPFQPPVPPDRVAITAPKATDSLIVPHGLSRKVDGGHADSTVDQVENERRIQEREVRLTAQRIIAKHLQPGDDVENPADTFWKNIDLDLTGATLLGLDLDGCRIRTAQFGGATFEGYAGFHKATFEGDAGFDGARFEGDAGFRKATFEGDAGFRGARFEGDAGFREATFAGIARFRGATFEGDAGFRGAAFVMDTGFDGVTFAGTAMFDGATFVGTAVFEDATFVRDAWFDDAKLRGAGFSGATFEGDARFRGTVFEGFAGFSGVRFEGSAGFTGGRFEGGVGFIGARVRLDTVPVPERVWPGGISVADPGSAQESALEGRDGVWGYLVPVRDTSQPDKGV